MDQQSMIQTNIEANAMVQLSHVNRDVISKFEIENNYLFNFYYKIMLESAALRDSPLRHPFIPITSPTYSRPTTRPKSQSKPPQLFYSHLHQPHINININARIETAQVQSRSSSRIERRSQKNNNLIKLLQQNQQESKKCMEEDSSKLRQQIWVKIQGMFRRIREYGDQFYEGLENVIISRYETGGTDAERQYLHKRQDNLPNSPTLNAQISKSLITSLTTNPCLYNKQKMQKISSKIINKIERYFEQITDKYIQQLFSTTIPTNPQISRKQQLATDHLNSSSYSIRSGNKFKEHKSMSVQKRYNDNFNIDNETHNFQTTSGFYDHIRKEKQKERRDKLKKDGQFKEFYEKISASKNTSKMMSNQRNDTSFQDNIHGSGFVKSGDENPYGLSASANTNTNNIIKGKQVLNFPIQAQSPKQVQFSISSQSQKSIPIPYHSQIYPNNNNYLVNPILFNKTSKSIHSHISPTSKLITHAAGQTSLRDKIRYGQNNPITNIGNSPIISRTVDSNLEASYDNLKSGKHSVIRSITANNDPSNMQNQNTRIKPIQYIVSANQQALTCDWCEELSVNSNMYTIYVNNNKHDSSYILPEFNRQLPTKVDNPNNNSLHFSQNKSQKSEKQRKQAAQSQISQSFQNTLLCLTYCNNYTHLAIASKNTLIYVYQSLSNELVTKLGGHSSAVVCLYYQNGILFSGGDVGCNSIYLWNTSNWTIRSKITYHSAAVSGIVGIASTDCIVSCGFDRRLGIYDYAKSVVCDLWGQGRSQESGNNVYVSLLYYEQLQKLVAMTPSDTCAVFQVIMATDKYKLKYDIAIKCNAKISAIQKSTTISTNLLIIALHSGFVQLYNLPQCNKLNRIEVGHGSALNMISFSRNNKPIHPLVLMVCFASKILYLVNTESCFVSQHNVRGNLDIVMSTGIGPAMIVNDRYQLAWLDQTLGAGKVHIAKFNMH